MNKIIFSFVLSIIGFSSFAQQFEIPSEQYPFYQILEWKGMGSILLNRDPSGNAKKVNLTFISNEPRSIWQESFNPNGKDFHFIASENSRYVYFLDNLELEAGKISMHQLNSAGNIKSTSVSVSSAVKKLGAYDVSEMQLIDVVTTDKALVHIFRYHDNKEKKYTEIATFITHHNLLVYTAILGEVTDANLKENSTYGMWNYIGFTDDQISFAVRDYQNRNKGWSVKNFTSKGALIDTRFIIGPKENFELIEYVGIGTNGKAYLNKNNNNETGILSFINKELYMTGVVTEGSAKVVKLKKLIEGEWIEVQSFKFSNDSSKKQLSFGVNPLNEGIACKIGSDAVFLPFVKEKKAVQNQFSELYHINPSRFMMNTKKEVFTVSLSDGNLSFELNQLNKAGNVTFEFIKK